VFQNWIFAMQPIVGVECKGVAITDLRCLVERHGINERGGQIRHIEAHDQPSARAPALRGRRSEVVLDGPEVPMLRETDIFTRNDSVDKLREKGNLVRRGWG
jgi:hypothetical protein